MVTPHLPRGFFAALVLVATVAVRAEPAARWELAGPGAIPTIYVDSPAEKAVGRAARDLATDIQGVTGLVPRQAKKPDGLRGPVVLVGILGESPVIDGLVTAGKLDVTGVAGTWESNVVAVVEHPLAGVDRALVIAGSDRRGAIYGLYSISEAIGVSPWAWWADVPVKHQAEVWLDPAARQLTSPAVKYRGIFLNDEDWGLRVWAAKTYDPATGNIGPKTYAKIFELLLRLRGNTLWPAMHPGTKAFNYYPSDKVVADEYGIVMGSSHAEPMLRDNVDEWNHEVRGDFDYGSNRTQVLAYWDQRVRENAAFESIYTVGMRGIHDGPMQGGGTIDERAEKLRQIMTDQRAILAKWVNPAVASVPQMFCPYKEVLPIYEHDPSIVPDDVTLEWPDDNYGYIQHYSTAKERARSGGAGVYYHASYWGRPYDYLWLCTTPPGLIAEEMEKAYAYGARQLWILNVGDLKPAELDMDFFLRLAWDPSSWAPATGQHDFLVRWVSRNLGPVHAEEIAKVMDEYYRLNFQRKPEHMGIDPKNRLLAAPAFSLVNNPTETNARLKEFDELTARATRIGTSLEPALQDAYFQLVLYPVAGSALMNHKGIYQGAHDDLAKSDPAAAAADLAEALRAQDGIDRLTRQYNTAMSGGKWKGMMSDAPREQGVFASPAASGVRASVEWSGPAFPEHAVILPAATASKLFPGNDATWRVVGGVGYEGASLVALPETAPSRSAPEAIMATSPRIEFKVTVEQAGDWDVVLRGPPTWPVNRAVGLRYAVAFDDEPLQLVTRPRYGNEFDPAWQEDVLRNAAFSTSHHHLSAGPHVLKVWRVDPGLILDAFLVTPHGESRGGYAWPVDRPVVPVPAS